MPARRVVTGYVDGKSTIVSDRFVEGYAFKGVPGFVQTTLWGTDTSFQKTTNIVEPVITSLVPPPGGSCFCFTTMPPDSVMVSPGFDHNLALSEYARELPGLAETFEPDAPGMHRTPTIDYGILLSGELWLELDDGELCPLKPMDVVVQNGTRHAWRNRSDQPAVMAFVLIGNGKA